MKKEKIIEAVIDEKEKWDNKDKIVAVLVGIILVLVIAITVVTLIKPKAKEETDQVKFANEYTQVTENNVFVYKTLDEIIKILENGTGVVYLGFPECPWCQRYVKYLNEVALDLGVEKIYYYNILEDRKNNTESYQKTVEILKDYLQYDQEGNKRIYVPSIITIKKGEIVGFDDETAWDTKGFEKPEEYWTKEEVKDLKEKLEEMISNADINICTDCNK